MKHWFQRKAHGDAAGNGFARPRGTQATPVTGTTSGPGPAVPRPPEPGVPQPDTGPTQAGTPRPRPSDITTLSELGLQFGHDLLVNRPFLGSQDKARLEWARSNAVVVTSPSRGHTVLLYVSSARGTIMLQQLRASLHKAHPGFHETVVPASVLREIHDQVSLPPGRSAGEGGSLQVPGTLADRQFEELCMQAMALHASDIHLRIRNDGGEQTGRVLFRVDGELEPAAEMPPDQLTEIVAAAYAKADAKSVPEGQGQFNLLRPFGAFIRLDTLRHLELRFQSQSERYGADAVLRLLNYDGKSCYTADLRGAGYLPSQIALFEEAAYGPGGSVLMIGETGSGKTTTLMALAQNHPGLVSGRLYASAVEDPPEGRPPHLSQFPVARSAETGSKGDHNPFATALRALMRMDGDVIVLGEIRDGATAEMWQELCLTGHKIYATFHAPSSIGGIERLCSSMMGLHPETVASVDVLSLAIAQKLVPRLCPHCRVPATTDGAFAPARLQALHRLGIDPERTYVRSAPGCSQCRGGRKGVQAVAEMFNPQTGHRRLIAAGRFSEAFHAWRETRTAAFDDPDVQGKTALEVGLYFAAQGVIGVDTLDSAIGRILGHEPVGAGHA